MFSFLKFLKKDNIIRKIYNADLKIIYSMYGGFLLKKHLTKLSFLFFFRLTANYIYLNRFRLMSKNSPESIFGTGKGD